MRKLVTWTLVTVGVAALVRRLRRRKELSVESAAADPAVELRRKLDESRAAEPDEASSGEGTIEARRAEVHNQGRATLDEMREPTDG